MQLIDFQGDIVPFTEFVPEAKQFVDRIVLRKNDSARSIHRDCRLFEKLDVRGFPARNRAVEGLQGSFEDGLDCTVEVMQQHRRSVELISTWSYVVPGRQVGYVLIRVRQVGPQTGSELFKGNLGGVHGICNPKRSMLSRSACGTDSRFASSTERPARTVNS